MARRKKRGKRYVGDQILAAFQAVTSCCGLGFLVLVSAAGFGVAFSPSVLSSIKKQTPPDLQFLVRPEMAAGVGAAAALWAIFFIWLTIATWQSKRWALWVNLFLNVPALGVLGIPEYRASAILPIVIVVYCLLRVTGAIGPKT